MQIFSRKITIALVATFIFSLIFSIIGYIGTEEQYISFRSMVFIFVIVSAPMFLIIGVATSYIFEKFLLNEWVKFFSYIVMGAVLIIPYTMYIFNNGMNPPFVLIGAFGAALFYGVQKLFQKYIFKA